MAGVRSRAADWRRVGHSCQSKCFFPANHVSPQIVSANQTEILETVTFFMSEML